MHSFQQIVYKFNMDLKVILYFLIKSKKGLPQQSP
ncbi:hypothetical protein QFZ77_003451 [Paenibacillus sp. V4I3]|nr:hypothetical protein [Paenibacillus sp. V4I3]MDQ0889455.1 hypothetical protein [Paenibacillus sp. V4I9]